MAENAPAWRLISRGASGGWLSLDRPRVMAILNVTPDSFSDGGRFARADDVAVAAAEAIDHGADMLDIGGESTRPGAARVEPAEQIDRVAPAIRAVRGAGIDAPISIDTTRAEVAAAALEAGANAINDVSGGTEDPGVLRLAASSGAGLILMHRVAPPDRDRYSDAYREAPLEGDVVEAVRLKLEELAGAALTAGVARESIVLDPGLGFGKTVEQNIELARRTEAIVSLGYPVLAGASRKSFTGRAGMSETDREPPPAGERLGASIAFSLVQLGAGARLFRVHDAGEQGRALRAAWRLGMGRTRA